MAKKDYRKIYEWERVEKLKQKDLLLIKINHLDAVKRKIQILEKELAELKITQDALMR